MLKSVFKMVSAPVLITRFSPLRLFILPLRIPEMVVMLVLFLKKACLISFGLKYRTSELLILISSMSKFKIAKDIESFIDFKEGY